MSMTYDEMTAALLEANTSLNEKLGSPAYIAFKLIMRDSGKWTLGTAYHDLTMDEKTTCPFSDTPEGAFLAAMEVIAKIPSADDRKMQAFQKQLAETIDMGREMGIDVKFINPIIETARELASNAITKEQAP